MSSKDIRRHTRRMSRSFSFSDTSFNDNSSSSKTLDHTPIPSTPLRYLGIPFSWEQVPGIPKKNTSKNNESSYPLLPLPPSGNAIHPLPTMKKFNNSRSFGKDPFLAAFLECSKDKKFDINVAFNKDEKFSAGQRNGFVVSMYSSCKRTCSVSESIVYRRRSSDQDYF
uniref:uncharacterized protein LOC122580059 n=1 Tax=Erigeron canadensis TaxID=72917 RepID=UPI001CB90B3D|nr:uncharacterized protein LOC122580059 [Erigeron canadensis]